MNVFLPFHLQFLQPSNTNTCLSFVFPTLIFPNSLAFLTSDYQLRSFFPRDVLTFDLATFIMRSVAVTSFALVAASSVLAVPMQARSESVADTAGGAPPNGPPPAKISDDAIADFQGVNFLENLEAAFFEEGLKNLTAWNKDHDLDFTIDVVTKVHAVSFSDIFSRSRSGTLQLTLPL